MKFENWSNKQLCYIFVGGLVIFSLLRWDADAWLSRQLDNILAQNHIRMQYQSLSWQGSSIELSNVQLHIPNLPNQLLLDSVQVGLDWSALWHGGMALKLTGNNAFIQANASLSSHDETLKLDKVHGIFDVKSAQVWFGQSALLQASGQAVLAGSLDVDMQTRLPTAIHLQIQWQQASVNVLNQDYMLGDYRLKLDDQSWQLQGGEQLQLNGKGSLVVSAQPIMQWPLQGNVQVHAKEGGAIANILPSNKMDVNFTGALGNPRWRTR